MNNKNKAKILASLLAGTLLIQTQVSYADKLSDLKKEKQQEQQNINKKRSEIKDLESQKNSLFKKIADNERKLEEVAKKLEELSAQITKLEDDIKTSEKNIEELQIRIRKNEELFKKRVAVMYGNKNLNSIEILFTSGNIREFISRFFMMQSIADYDKKLITQLKNDKVALENEKAKLVASKEEKVKAKEALLASQDDYRNAIAQNQSLIAQLQQSISVTEDEVRKMEARVMSLGANISFEEKVKAEAIRAVYEKQNNIDNSTFTPSAGGGQMSWPLSGYTRISSPWGWRSDPFGGDSGHKHTGIDIPAPMGTPVHSATDGVVIRSGWAGSYGKCVMIRYTNNITVVYGHNSELLVKEGQQVKRGQTISLVGSTGNSTGPHLHFEVRVNGINTNPIPFLK